MALAIFFFNPYDIEGNYQSRVLVPVLPILLLPPTLFPTTYPTFSNLLPFWLPLRIPLPSRPILDGLALCHELRRRLRVLRLLPRGLVHLQMGSVRCVVVLRLLAVACVFVDFCVNPNTLHVTPNSIIPQGPRPSPFTLHPSPRQAQVRS